MGTGSTPRNYPTRHCKCESAVSTMQEAPVDRPRPPGGEGASNVRPPEPNIEVSTLTKNLVSGWRESRRAAHAGVPFHDAIFPWN